MSPGNMDSGNLKGQEVKNLGKNRKNQGNDDLIAKNSASVGGAGAPTDKSLETNKNTPHGQKMV